MLKSPNILPVAVWFGLGLFIFTIGIAINCTFIDEVYFADPVINYLHGDGYTTTAWKVTRQFETHVSTAPAYSLLLLMWLKVFGISQTAVRTLPAALALGCAWVFWRACLRSGMIQSSMAGAMAICVMLLDYGFAFSYTCGRPDSLSALLVAALFYFSTLSDRRIALGAIGVTTALLPFVQWGCVIYVILASVTLLFIFGRRFVPHIMIAGTGIVIGLLIQKAAYTHFGLWDTWMNTIKSEGSENITQRIEYRMTWDTLIHHHSNSLPKDFSALVILAGMAWAYGRGKLSRSKEGVPLAKAAWIIAIIITAGMYFVGKFPTYYGWMLGMPLAAILAAYFEKSAATDRFSAKVTVAIAIVACGVGLPLQAGLASHDWKERKPAAVAAWLEPHIHTNDIVYCDYSFYFIAKARAKSVFTGHYFTLMTQEELSHITLAIIAENDSDWRQSKDILTNATAIWSWKPAKSGLLGNNWRYGFLSAPNYSCTLYQLNKPLN